jgi:hypothetical protein
LAFSPDGFRLVVIGSSPGRLQFDSSRFVAAGSQSRQNRS